MKSPTPAPLRKALKVSADLANHYGALVTYVGVGMSLAGATTNELSAIAGKARLMPADAVARAIVRGLDRGTFAIYPNFQSAFLGRTASLVSPIYFAVFDRAARRTRRG